MKAQRTFGSAIQKARGFTLIELLVVIAIIVILAGILIAAMPGAKKAAYDATTRAELAGLSTDCDNYFMDCDAYPGPLPPTMTANANTGGKISGAQNMLLGLTYAIYASPVYTSGSPPTIASPYTAALAPTPSTVATGWVTLPSPAVGQVNPTDANGAVNYAASPIRTLKAYYSPTPKESATISGVLNINTFNFPTIVDRYPDALPILYYRKTPGVDGTATVTLNPSGNGVASPPSEGTPAMVVNIASSVNPSSYYFYDNDEYTQASALRSPSGQIFQESSNTGSGTSGPNSDITYFGLNQSTLVPLVCNAPMSGPGGGTLTVSARGGFVLISAGYDHFYGAYNKTGINDDIVVVGGH